MTVYWAVPVYADDIEVHANRVDVRIVDKENQTVTLLEMSCPWVENREQKEKEKTLKYAPLRLELKQQYPGYKINQVNNIIDVLGGYSKELYSSVRDLLGAERSKELKPFSVAELVQRKKMLHLVKRKNPFQAAAGMYSAKRKTKLS